MSSQQQMLVSFIRQAREGSDAALSLVRRICVDAAEAAPKEDLLRMAELLTGFGHAAENNGEK